MSAYTSKIPILESHCIEHFFTLPFPLTNSPGGFMYFHSEDCTVG